MVFLTIFATLGSHNYVWNGCITYRNMNGISVILILPFNFNSFVRNHLKFFYIKMPGLQIISNHVGVSIPPVLNRNIIF